MGQLNIIRSVILVNANTTVAKRNAALMLCALLAAISFPPSFLWLIALVAFVPFYSVLEETESSFFAYFLTGLVYNVLTIFWLGLNSDPPPVVAILSMLGAASWLSLHWGFAALVIKWISRRIGKVALWWHPAAVVSIDWLVESTEMAFPWNYIGATQSLNPFLRPVVAIGGIHILTFIVLLINLMVYKWVKNSLRSPMPIENAANNLVARILGKLQATTQRVWFWPAIICCTMLASFLLGKIGTLEIEDSGRQVEVGIIQANIDPIQKWTNPFRWTVDQHLSLSDSLLEHKSGIQLLLWPETAVPTRLKYRTKLKQELIKYCKDKEILLISGANDLLKFGQVLKPYNGAFLISGKGIEDSYHKHYLVPFGERVPGQKMFPFLGKINLGQAEFAAGTKFSAGIAALSIEDTLRFGWSICYEANFSELARKMTLDGAEVLVNLTNDGWFGTSLELDQHLAIASLRCIETGRWMIRVTNNGYSAVIDHFGNAVELMPKGREAAFSSAVKRMSGKTFYTRFGDIFSRIALLAFSWVILLALISGRRVAIR
jgi:apolipoprotein N-acyltransferase